MGMVATIERLRVRLARSCFVLALLFAAQSLGLPADAAGLDVPRSSIIGGDIKDDRQDWQHQNWQLAQLSDRQRERDRARRDRTQRRFLRGGAEILPHFADYTIHETGFATTRFASAHGVLTVELVNDCGDWTLQEKLDLDLKDEAKQAFPSDLLYRASEVRSADRFVFAYSRQHLDERLDFIGDVIPIDGGQIVRFQEPETEDVVLPAEVNFPITHWRQVLAAARRDNAGFEAVVFDGGNNFAYRAVTTVGHSLRDDDPNPRVVTARTELDPRTSDRLPDGRSWPVRIDYFPLDDDFAPPVLVREFLLHESGIVLSFHFDYGDIQMDARLKNLDIREARTCPN